MKNCYKLFFLIVSLSLYEILIFATEQAAEQNERCGYKGHTCSDGLECHYVGKDKDGEINMCVGRGLINDYCPEHDKEVGSPHCGGSRVCRNISEDEKNPHYRCVGGGKKGDYCRRNDPESKDCKGSLLCRESKGFYKCVERK